MSARDPQRRDRTRPWELIGLSAALAAFVGGAVILATRQWLLALEFAGLAFIVALVVLAMLLLATSRGPGDDGGAGGDVVDGGAGPASDDRGH